MKSKDYYGYLIIAAVVIVIFFSNLFQNLLLLDYTPSIYHGFTKVMLMSNYSFNNSIFTFIFSYGFMFTLGILIAMLLSYFYIKKLSKYPLLFAFIYFFNPFIYSRIMVGQLGVILAYLLLPVFIYYILDKDKTSLYKAIIVAAIIGSIQAQFFAITIGLFLLSLFFYKHNRKLKPVVLFLILTIALSAFWIQGLFQNQIFNDITITHESFFAPKLSQDVPAIAKIMSMYGFWREVGYQTSYRMLPIVLWYILLALLLILFLIGYFHNSKHTFYFALWWAGILLAVGISHPFTQNLFSFLFNNVPFFNGFRDSHKFVALVALAYAFLIPEAVIYLQSKMKKFIPIIIAVMTIALLSLPLINLNNQIHATNYPDSYKSTAAYMDAQVIRGKSIYLPWELYLTYNWTTRASPDGRIPVPINNIVKPIILTGPDAWGTTTAFQKNITICLANQSITCLENQAVEYILYDHCAHYPAYKINATIVHEDSCITIYHLPAQQVTTTHPVPVGFIIGMIISILALVIVIIVITRS